MENKQTAVEWFVTQLEKHLLSENIKIDLKNTEAYDQAKQMEREQIEDAYLNGFINCPSPSYIGKVITSSDYFTQTYNNGKDS